MTNYEKYVELQKQLDVLESAKEDLRKLIESELPEDGYKDDSITVFWTPKKVWKYSENVDKATDELKTLKKEEEEKGIASFEEKKQLTIKVK